MAASKVTGSVSGEGHINIGGDVRFDPPIEIMEVCVAVHVECWGGKHKEVANAAL